MIVTQDAQRTAWRMRSSAGSGGLDGVSIRDLDLDARLWQRSIRCQSGVPNKACAA